MSEILSYLGATVLSASLTGANIIPSVFQNTDNRTCEKRYVVVVGEGGAGKSSLVNMAIGKPVAKTSDKAVGCSFTSSHYDDLPGFRFFDTVGLNEASTGTVSSEEAMVQLTTLLKSIRRGVNLLVFVMRKNRITDSMVNNYNLFVRGICQGKVPVILAVTACDMDSDPEAWYKENEADFEKNDMKFDGVVSGCFDFDLQKIKPSLHEAFGEVYEETHKKLNDLLMDPRFAKKHDFGGWLQWIKHVMTVVAQFIPGINVQTGFSSAVEQLPELGVEAAEMTNVSPNATGKTSKKLKKTKSSSTSCCFGAGTDGITEPV